jgi:phage recombination protein Bet
MIQTLIQTVFPHGANDSPPSWSQLAMFMSVAQQYNLNPFILQIYAFPDKKSGGVVPIVPVDGWVTLVQRQAQHDGEKFLYHWDDGTTTEGAVPPVTVDEKQKRITARIAAITAIIYRKDHTHPTEVTELYAECYRDTGPWNGMPTRLLRHKAYMQCGRIAYGLAGLYDEDEARDIIQGGTLEYSDAPSNAGVSHAGAAQGYTNKVSEIKEKLEAAKNGKEAPQQGTAEVATSQTETPAGEQKATTQQVEPSTEAKSDNRTTEPKQFQYEGKILEVSEARTVRAKAGAKKNTNPKQYVILKLQDYEHEVFCFSSTLAKLAKENLRKVVGLTLIPTGPKKLVNLKGFFYIEDTEYDGDVPVIRREEVKPEPETKAAEVVPAAAEPVVDEHEVTEEDLSQYGEPGLFNDGKKDDDDKW